MFRDKIFAAIRTGCATFGPAAITALVALFGGWGINIEIDSSWGLALAGFTYALVTAGYNFVANWLSGKPRLAWVGWLLLGVNKQPSYTNTPSDGNDVFPDEDDLS